MQAGLGGRRIAIVGGGIAGLAAAAALAARGARVLVIEQAAALREFGAGLQISPNGMAVLRALGVADRAIAAGCRAERLDLVEGARGRPLLSMRLGAEAPYVFLHRGALLVLLAEAARAAGAEVRTGQRVTLDSGVPPRLLTDGAALHVAGAAPDLILGADGIHSVIRPVVDRPGPATFTGQVAWRAVVPLEPGAEAAVTVATGPGRHLVSYPLGEGLRNIVAVEERAAWADERWNQPDTPDHLRQAFAGFAPRMQDWLARVEDVHLWGLFRHPVAGRWHLGGTAILGDAAHPTLPFLAQGANLALEDAWVLAACLARHPQAEALAEWQALREARVRRTVAAAEANARNYHLRGPARAVAHLALRLGGRIAPNAAAARFDWLYRHDVTRD